MKTKLTKLDQDPFLLEGDLESAQVGEVYQRTRASCQSGNIPAEISLTKLGKTDSSLLALLLEWQSQARARKQVITFADPPPGVRVLAKLSQASELLGWDESSERELNGDRS